MKSRQTILLAIAIGALRLASPLCDEARAAEHPTLVDIASAQCSVCHEDLFEGKPLVHSPVAEDCTLCHELSAGDGGTTVELAAAEPGLCLMCHDELEAAVSLELEAPHMALEGSCLDCHEAHASAEASLKAASTAELCANCHDLDDLDGAHDGQLTPATDCASCHAPHGSDNPGMLTAQRQHAPFADGSCSGCHRKPFGERLRLRARGERLCTACHGEFPELAESGSRHAALQGLQGRAGCLSCHDPHMSPNAAMLLAAGPGLCEPCHDGVVAAALAATGHAAAEDCGNCHRPHTAEEPHLLAAAPDELCGSCHDLADEALGAAHLGADPAALACTSCHSPHGAGHVKLLAENLHPPLEEGCDTCHEGAFDELAEAGGAGLCLMCHDDIGELASSAAVPHAAMEMEDCTLCHNPHASAQRKLVKLPGGGECAECHPDQAAGADEFAHGVIDLIGCEACHEPHGGGQEKLLRRSGAELCLGCHRQGAAEAAEGATTVTLLDRFEVPAPLALSYVILTPDGERGHPLQEHRTLGTASAEEMARMPVLFSGVLTCTSCHDPHKGRSPLLLLGGATNTSEACQACHEK